MSSLLEQVRAQLVKYEQDHLLKFIDKATEEEQERFLKFLHGLDFEHLTSDFRRAMECELKGPRKEREMQDIRRGKHEGIGDGTVGGLMYQIFQILAQRQNTTYSYSCTLVQTSFWLSSSSY